MDTLTVTCKYCPASLSLPINSRKDLVKSYGELTVLYSKHLTACHSDKILEELENFNGGNIKLKGGE